MHSKCSSKSRLQCRRLASEIKGLCYMPHALRCNIHTAVLFNSASIHCFVFWFFFLICISLLRSHRSIWIRFRVRFILCHYYIFILFFYRHLLAIWLRSFHVHLASHNTISLNVPFASALQTRYLLGLEHLTTKKYQVCKNLQIYQPPDPGLFPILDLCALHLFMLSFLSFTKSFRFSCFYFHFQWLG